jgi:hypothetical protein
MHTLVVSL